MRRKESHVFPVVVEGNRLRLRELRAEDYAVLCRLWGDPVIAHYMALSAMTPGEVQQAIEEAQAEARSRPRSDYMLGAARIADNVLAGTVRLSVGDQRSIYCSRLTVCRDVQNMGYASEIVDLSNRFCFTTLKAHRVWGVVHEDNQAAQQVMMHAGMTFEGRVRDFFYARDAWHNVVSYSILENEWQLRPAGRVPS
jgi:RimJ/RimL family protein N-acetyltransferase